MALGNGTTTTETAVKSNISQDKSSAPVIANGMETLPKSGKQVSDKFLSAASSVRVPRLDEIDLFENFNPSRLVST